MRTSLLITLLTLSSSTFASEADLRQELDRLSQKVENLEKTDSASKTTLGGYGVINYNKYEKTNSRNQFDLSRFVFSMTHEFDDQFMFNGEVEVEHAISSKEDDGEVEIEQAWVNYQVTPKVNIKAGLFLMPFGFLNLAHEPPVYYGVERNEVETRIIPSTWREGGVGAYGATDAGIEWEGGLVTGFNMAGFDDPGAPLAGSHQEGQLAKAQDLSVYGVVNYRIPAVMAGVGMFTGKTMHSNADFRNDNSNPDFEGIDGRLTLAEAHARWQQYGFDVQALYAMGKLGDAGSINDAINTWNIVNAATPADERPFVPEEFMGWMLQAAYKLDVGTKAALAPFVRYEEFDTQSKMPAGYAADPANKDKVTTVGLNYLPHPQVVYKIDYQIYGDHAENNRADLGLGYMF